ncbi:MAG TPA: serine/threonine-protein kinase [Burkholderiaceae bacterium]|nr:serine/threonine-protein kinase [Burkholderiaceae bacterium]
MIADAVDLAALSQLLTQALDLLPAAREAWLTALPAKHAHLVPVLRKMLARAESPETDDFLRTLPKLDRASEPPVADRIEGEQVGPYRLLRVLGRGGMGTVWLAERSDGTLKRKVALKLPLIAGHPQMRERLVRERDLLATLEHPHIARLYDAGVDANGQPYLALEFVEGQPIDAFCRALGLDLRARLEIFVQAARAVAHAHARLVLHRDLKPNNILVTADAQVRLLDFGIAKLLEDGSTQETRLTQVEGRALTPEYASPEQIIGQPLTVASDVYALGVVLYELLSGTRPYKLKRDSRGALEDAILATEPAPPSSIVQERVQRRQLLGDLDTIVLKALKKSPAERYPTAIALVDDIERHLTGAPVLARPDTAAYRLLRYLRRHKLPAAIVAGIALALLGGAVPTAAIMIALAIGAAVATWQAAFARRQAAIARERSHQAELQAANARAVQDFLLDLFRANDVRQANPLRAQEMTVRELLDVGAARIEARLTDQPTTRFEILKTLRGLYGTLGDPRRASHFARKELELATSLYGPNSPQSARALQQLADTVRYTSGAGEALAFALQAQRAYDACGDTKSFDRGTLHIVLCDLLDATDIDAADNHAAVAVSILGQWPSDVSYALALSKRALMRVRRADWASAEEYIARAIGLYESRGADANPLLTEAYNGLATIQERQLRFAEAEANFHRAIEFSERTYGRDHVQGLVFRARFALFFATTSRLAESLARAKECWTALQGSSGPPEAFAARVQLRLGTIELEYGLLAEASTHLRSALQGVQATQPNTRVLAEVALPAAQAAIESGDYDLAKQRLAMVRTYLDASGRGAPDSIRTELAFASARLCVATSAFDEALAALPRLSSHDPPANLDQLTYSVEESEIRMDCGDHLQAQRRAADVARFVESNSALRQPLQLLRARADAVCGRAALAHGDAVAATARLHAAHEAQARLLDPASPRLITTMLWYARALLASGERGRALDLVRPSRELLDTRMRVAPTRRRLLLDVERKTCLEPSPDAR